MAESSSSLEIGLEVMFCLVLALAIIMNIITLCLIRRLKFIQIDMWLGCWLAICDLGFSFFKLGEYICHHLKYYFPNLKFILSYRYRKGLFYSITLHTITCVAYLAIVRWLVIVKKFKVQKKLAIFIYIIQIVIAGSLILSPVFYDGYIANGPIPHITIIIAGLTLVISFLFCIIIINFSYTSIGWNYIRYNRPRTFRPSHLLIDPSPRVNSYTIIIKILIILIFYNISMVPFTIIALLEKIYPDSITLQLEYLSKFSSIWIPLINPLLLLTLHDQTWYQFKLLFSRS